MTKTLLSIFTMIYSANALATTTLHIPVFVRDEQTDKIYSMDQINPLLKKKGLKTFSEYFEFTDENVGKADYKKIGAFQAELERELTKAGLKDYIVDSELVPATDETPTAKTCFVGDGAKVPEITGSLGDLFYSDQMSLHGWKYKTKTLVHDDNQELSDFLEKESAVWKNWDSDREEVLILNAVGDNGDDIQESVVAPCGL